MENTWEHVSVYWQRGKIQLRGYCFMRLSPVSNAGLRISRHLLPPIAISIYQDPSGLAPAERYQTYVVGLVWLLLTDKRYTYILFAMCNLGFTKRTNFQNYDTTTTRTMTTTLSYQCLLCLILAENFTHLPAYLTSLFRSRRSEDLGLVFEQNDIVQA